MAILYDADLTPSKAELVALLLDRKPWGGSGPVDLVGSYRFDDPDGQVGVEVHLVRREGQLLHVPLAYRPAPLAGGENALVGTMDHSVLGDRWIYDGALDPVAVGCFERALAGDQQQAALEMHEGENVVARPEPNVHLTLRPGQETEPGDLRLAQRVGEPLAGARELLATWDGGQAVVAVR